MNSTPIAVAREFEDEFGRVINADLVSHTGTGATSVTIKLKPSGKVIDLTISKLSDADQKFVREWMKETPPTIRYAFRIEGTKVSLPGSSREYYKVKVTNLARNKVEKLKVKIRTITDYRRASRLPDYYNYAGRFVGVEERFEIKEALAFNGTAEFEPRNSRRLLGVLVRIYDAEGEMIGEEKIGTTKIASLMWDDGKPAIGG